MGKVKKSKNIATPSLGVGVFTFEIKRILHACGDIANPLTSTAICIENIMWDQIKHVIIKAQILCVMRKTDIIGMEECVFLLHKNKVKMKRLLLFLDATEKSLKQSSLDLGEEEIKNCVEVSGPQKRKIEKCLEFIDCFDDGGILRDYVEDKQVDPESYLRLLKLDVFSRKLGASEYSFFCECRKVSFLNNTQSKFDAWIKSEFTEDTPHFSPIAWKIIKHFCYEICVQLIGMAIDYKTSFNYTDTRNVEEIPLDVNKPVSELYKETHTVKPITPNEILTCLEYYNIHINSYSYSKIKGILCIN